MKRWNLDDGIYQERCNSSGSTKKTSFPWCMSSLWWFLFIAVSTVTQTNLTSWYRCLFFASNHLHRKMQQYILRGWIGNPFPKKGATIDCSFEITAKNSMVQCGIWSAHTWWMVTFLPRLQREWLDTFPLKSNVGTRRGYFFERGIDESCYFFCWGYIAIITQTGQPGWHNVFRPQMFQHTDMHMMILNILPLWKILNSHIKQQKWSNISETSNHSFYQRHFKASWCFWLIFPGAETPERLTQAHGMARMLTKICKRHLLSLQPKIKI